MEWVVDAAVTLAWCFEAERTPHTDALFVRLLGGRRRGCSVDLAA